MTTFIAVIILVVCFGLMAVGLIFAKKVLKRGCTLGDDCTCKKNPESSPDNCEYKK